MEQNKQIYAVLKNRVIFEGTQKAFIDGELVEKLDGYLIQSNASNRVFDLKSLLSILKEKETIMGEFNNAVKSTSEEMDDYYKRVFTVTHPILSATNFVHDCGKIYADINILTDNPFLVNMINQAEGFALRIISDERNGCHTVVNIAACDLDIFKDRAKYNRLDWFDVILTTFEKQCLSGKGLPKDVWGFFEQRVCLFKSPKQSGFTTWGMMSAAKNLNVFYINEELSEECARCGPTFTGDLENTRFIIIDTNFQDKTPAQLLAPIIATRGLDALIKSKVIVLIGN